MGEVDGPTTRCCEPEADEPPALLDSGCEAPVCSQLPSMITTVMGSVTTTPDNWSPTSTAPPWLASTPFATVPSEVVICTAFWQSLTWLATPSNR